MENFSKKHVFLYVFTFLLFMAYLVAPLFPVSKADSQASFTYNAQEVAHFFTHQLIRDKDEAFKSSNKFKKYFENDLLTHQEFYNFINEMWQNGYSLVDIDDVVINLDGKIFLNGSVDCNGRKPMLLSFDDMSFDLIGNALCDKLVVDENGDVASYTKNVSGNIEYDKESIPILENFIKLHPEFSCGGARATICVTGYNGILGYRTQKDSYKNRDEEIKSAKKLVNKLKQLGYKFACHTYGHKNVENITTWDLKQDLERFKNEVVPIIGKTSIFCFPYGSKTFEETKIEVLKDYGYNILFCIDLVDGYKLQDNVIWLSRMVIDRNNLKNCYNEYLKYFDANKVVI